MIKKLQALENLLTMQETGSDQKLKIDISNAGNRVRARILEDVVKAR